MADSALIDDLEKQFAENPRRVFARLANEYRKAGDAERAIEICRHHVPQQPGYISGHIVLGQALFDTAQFDEARSAFETALGLDPENLIALRQLGDIARETGDLEGARSWYRRLLEVDPQNDEVAEQLQALDGNAGDAVPATPTESAAAPDQEQIHWGDIHPEEPTSTSHGAPPANLDEGTPLPELSLAPDADSAASAERSDAVPPLVEPDIVLDTSALAEPPADAADESAPAAADPEVLVPLELEQQAASGDAPAPAAVESEAAAATAATGDDGDQSAVGGDSEETSDAFVTETMAEVYVRQGFLEQALDIYRQLARQSPEEQRFTDAIAELEQAVALGAASSSTDSGAMAIAEEAAPVGPTIREFLNAIASRRAAARASDPGPDEPPGGEPPPLVQEKDDDAAPSQSEYQVPLTATGDSADAGVTGDVVEPAPTMEGASASPFGYDELFPGRSVAQRDAAAADTWAGGYANDFGMNGDQRGAPARPAPDALSLDAVFGDTAGPDGQASQEQSVSFDEFFASDAPAGERGTSADADAPPPDGSAGSPSDLELFHAWLEGLKK